MAQLNMYFKTTKDVFEALREAAKVYPSFSAARGMDKRISSVRRLIKLGLITHDQVFEIFGGRKTSAGTDNFNGFFKTKKEALDYLKTEAPKYKSFGEGRKLDPKINSFRGRIKANQISADEVYPYFGGRKSACGTSDLCIYFKDKKDVENYLKLHSSKYRSFSDAGLKDKKIKAIDHMIKRGLLSKSIIKPFFRLRGVWTKNDWISYLDVNWKNYSSLSLFIINDKKGWSLDDEVYKKERSVISLKEVQKRYWKDSNLDLREKKACKSLELKLKNIYLIKKVEPEFYLDRSSRVDFKITLRSGRIVLIEVKHDLSSWSRRELKEQITKYARLGKKTFGNKYQHTLLVSPNGKYGISFQKLIKSIK